MNYIDYGALIRKLREEKKMSRETLAKKAGYSRQTVYSIETGLRTSSIMALESILETLGYRLEVVKNGDTA